MRAERVILVAATVISVAIVAASATATTFRPMAAQAEDTALEPIPVAQLALGERFVGPGWDLEVQDAFVVDAPERPGWSEVRVAVALQSTFFPLPYLWAGFAGAPGYPELTIRDAADEARTIPVTDPAGYLVPGSALATIPPGIPARWTIGFQVQTAFVDSLAVEAGWEGQTLASWDLQGPVTAPAGWAPIEGLAVTSMAEPVPWSADLEITPVDHTILVCGDPATEQITAIYGLQVAVTNTGVDDQPFPNVQYPAPAAIAVWDDGSSARYSEQSHVMTEAGEDDPLPSRTIEQVMIPPETTHDRVMIFTVPRDSRFVDVEELPTAVVLIPPEEPPVWLDLGRTPVSDFVVFVGCENTVGGHPFGVDQNGAVEQPTPPPAEETVDGDAAPTTP